nr:DNA-directed RNA polymerases IV and V subunit 2-like [Tanacetum cinerariifolium]
YVLLPRHARLQNMTYSAQMKVQCTREVYTQELVRSDKFKTGKEKYLDKKTLEIKEHEKLLKLKIFEDQEGVIGDKSGDDAPIKGRSTNEGEPPTERISNDS